MCAGNSDHNINNTSFSASRRYVICNKNCTSVYMICGFYWINKKLFLSYIISRVLVKPSSLYAPIRSFVFFFLFFVLCKGVHTRMVNCTRCVHTLTQISIATNKHIRRVPKAYLCYRFHFNAGQKAAMEKQHLSTIYEAENGQTFNRSGLRPKQIYVRKYSQLWPWSLIDWI